jgi:peroxiredoxin
VVLNNKTLILLSITLTVILVLFHFSAKRQTPAGEVSFAATEKPPQRETAVAAMGQPLKDEAPMTEPFPHPPAWKEQASSDFTTEFLNNEKFTLSEHIGKKVVILNFFATWCDPCKEELQELGKYFAEHKKDNFLLIGIDADDPENTVRDFVRAYGFTFPTAIDHGGTLRTAFSISVLPATVFIGADGSVQRYDAGQIRNAHAAFDTLFLANMGIINAGGGITREAFLTRTIQKGGERQVVP